MSSTASAPNAPVGVWNPVGASPSRTRSVRYVALSAVNAYDSGVRSRETTLSNRLGDLTDAGFVERHSYDEIPPRVEYEATEKTHALTPIFEDLYDWAETYEAAE